MSDLDEFRDHLTQHAKDLPVRQEFSLVVLFRDQWEKVSAKTQMGRLFKSAVVAREFPDVEYVTIAVSGRNNVYWKKT